MNDINKRRWAHAKKHEFNRFNLILLILTVALLAYTFYSDFA